MESGQKNVPHSPGRKCGLCGSPLVEKNGVYVRCDCKPPAKVVVEPPLCVFGQGDFERRWPR